MRLGRLTSNSITHTDLHKPNNKLVNVWFEHFSAQTNHTQTRTHKTNHDPDLGETTTFPLIVYYVFGHMTSTQMSFCFGTPKRESWNSPKLGLLWLWRPITLCVDLRLKWGLKKNYSPCQEIFNNISHATCT
jgi:hypothetical protein